MSQIRKNQLGNPVTPHNINQFQTNMYNNLSPAFTPNTPLINAPDYINRKQLLHNNVNEKVFSERVVEYRAIMNSSDRDRSKFPSPFKMQVSFGNANVEPNIDEYMTNVKYVTLNNIWVPRTLAIDTSLIDMPNKKYDIYPVDSLLNTDNLIPPDSNHYKYNLGVRPFLVLKIKELDDNHLKGTCPLFQRDSFMIVPDQRVGDMYIFKPKRSTIIYPSSQLKNLGLFSLHLLDFNGKELSIVDYTGKKIIGQPITNNLNCDFNQYIEKYGENESVKYTDEVTQVIYDFTFGIIENEINTMTNYNKV